MTDTGTPPAPPLPPQLSKSGRWLKIALVASLAVNLLFVGGAAARWYMGYGPERMARTLQMQLIPRRFFMELDHGRRTELLAVFKSYDRQFRDGRKVAREQVAALADALDAEPYDAAKVTAAIDGFKTSSETLYATGGDAALTLIGKLTPVERKQLAQQLRRSRSAPDAKRAGKTSDAP